MSVLAGCLFVAFCCCAIHSTPFGVDVWMAWLRHQPISIFFKYLSIVWLSCLDYLYRITTEEMWRKTDKSRKHIIFARLKRHRKCRTHSVGHFLALWYRINVIAYQWFGVSIHSLMIHCTITDDKLLLIMSKKRPAHGPATTNSDRKLNILYLRW